VNAKLAAPEQCDAMKRINVGDRAPDFTATAQDGSTIRLTDYLSKQAVVLFFYPKDGTSICTKEACSFRDSYSRFVAAGAEVIGVSSDSAQAHQKFAAQNQLPFRLISDDDGALRRAFGVRKTLGLLPGRATYVIDKQGIVRLVFSAQFASDEHVRQALEAVGSSN
jgi:peroxiredoxin Q/BCP